MLENTGLRLRAPGPASSSFQSDPRNKGPRGRASHFPMLAGRVHFTQSQTAPTSYFSCEVRSLTANVPKALALGDGRDGWARTPLPGTEPLKRHVALPYSRLRSP